MAGLEIGPEILLACLMFGAAALYASVGHAGASAYIALMALFSIAPATARPTALALNIVVASLVALRFSRAGHFRWRIVWPLLLGAIPMAFLGGYIQPPAALYRPLVGVLLLIAAARLAWPGAAPAEDKPTHPPPVLGGALVGAGIGFLSGLTGTGGGIFLSPILLGAGWAGVRGASAAAAVFILANSTAGLAGNLASLRALPADLPLFAAAVAAGALIGSRLGAISLSRTAIMRALAAVLTIAGLKLIFV